MLLNAPPRACGLVAGSLRSRISRAVVPTRVAPPALPASARAGRQFRVCRASSAGVNWDEEAEAYLNAQVKKSSGPEDDAKILRETTQLIKRLGREGDAVSAVAALAELGKAGIQPDIMAVTTAIGACIDSNDLTRGMRVFDEIVGSGVVKPDEMLFSILLRAQGRRSPPAWGEVSALLSKMRNTFGITPRLTTYNTLLEVCADNNDYDRGCQLIDRMEQEGVVPDQQTVSAVAKRRSLRAYLKRIPLA